MGHQAGHLEQALGVGTSEERAADYPLNGEVSGVRPAASGPGAAGHRIVVPQPAVEASDRLFGSLAEYDQGVAARLGGGGVDPVEQPVQADLPVGRNFVLGQADIDEDDASRVNGEVLDEA